MRHVVVLLVGALGSVTARGADHAAPGERVPPLTHVQWIKGEPVACFEQGRVYVVEFWSTWCAACATSIEPSNELARRHAFDATFVAIHVRPSESAPSPEEFLHRRQEAGLPCFDFPVGADQDGGVARDWLDAMFLEGLPVAMIVDRSSRLAWFGHARDVERPLNQVLQGALDIANETARMKRHMRVERLGKESGEAIERKDFSLGIQLIQEAWREDPDLVAPWLPSTYGHLLAISRSPEAAAPFALWLLESDAAICPEILAGTARAILHFKPRELRDLDLALRLARKAGTVDSARSAERSILIARIHMEKGDQRQAVTELDSALRGAANDDERSALVKALAETTSLPGE